jgi:hypothetical protein
MDEEQRKWQKQFSSHIGAREFLILAGVIMGWIFIGLLISLVTNSIGVIPIFFVTLFILAFFSTRWKPSYSMLYKLLGNENLPIEPFPRGFSIHSRQPRAWWSYLPSLGWLILEVILLILVIRYFAK